MAGAGAWSIASFQCTCQLLKFLETHCNPFIAAFSHQRMGLALPSLPAASCFRRHSHAMHGQAERTCSCAAKLEA
jgi:hypothetical protein